MPHPESNGDLRSPSRRRRLPFIVLAAVALAGCNGGGSDDGDDGNGGDNDGGGSGFKRGVLTNATGARPVVLYAHGTRTDRAFDLTNLQRSDDNPEATSWRHFSRHKATSSWRRTTRGTRVRHCPITRT